MGHHRVAIPILLERIVALSRPGGVPGPVRLKLLRTEHQYAFVAELEELDDGKGRPRLPETDAVSNDAAVVPQQSVDGAHRAVLLELVQGLPNRGIVQMNVV